MITHHSPSLSFVSPVQPVSLAPVSSLPPVSPVLSVSPSLSAADSTPPRSSYVPQPPSSLSPKKTLTLLGLQLCILHLFERLIIEGHQIIMSVVRPSDQGSFGAGYQTRFQLQRCEDCDNLLGTVAKVYWY